jgi:RNA polymerase sigma-70 factor, ECF subfamily
MLVCDKAMGAESSGLDAVQPPCAPRETKADPPRVTPEIRNAMLAAIPSLRAFAISLTRDTDYANDLVQDTILRAWKNIDRFEPGTNLNAWLFTILRNFFYSSYRKASRQVADPDGSYAARLGAPPEHDAKCDLQDMLEALSKLPVDRREALILIAAEGLSYEEAAQVCGVPVGTIRSRVNRARERLAQLLGVEDAEDLGLDQVTQAALQCTL